MLELLRAVIQVISLVTGVVLAANGRIPAPVVQQVEVIVMVTPNPTPTYTPIPKPVSTVITKAIEPTESLTKRVNNYRKNLSLNSLKNRNDVCQVANKRLGEIAANFNHDGFLAAIAPLGAKGWAENIWRGTPFSLDRVINEWDASPTHKQNLTGSFDFGCGANNGNEAVYIFIR